MTAGPENEKRLFIFYLFFVLFCFVAPISLHDLLNPANLVKSDIYGKKEAVNKSPPENCQRQNACFYNFTA